MFEKDQIILRHRVAAFRERVSLQHAERLSPSPVADDDPLANEIPAQLLNEINRRVRNGDLRGGLLQSGKLRLLERHWLAAIRTVTIMLRRGGANESNEASVSDVADSEAQQESVPKGFKFIALRHLVARAEKRDQRDLHLLGAIVEDPFIGDLQQRIQDRAARLEDFIEEDEFGLDKFSSRDAPVLVALESADRHRPKEFFRRRETSHQIGEVPQPGAVLWADAPGEFCNQRGLSCARRSENNQVLPREQCDQRSPNDLIAFDQRRRQFAF